MSLRGAYAGFGDENDPVRKVALQMRSICRSEVNLEVDDHPNDEFPEVDSNEVFAGIFIANS